MNGSPDEGQPPQPVLAPREAALALMDQWVQAFCRSDVDAITALYAPAATFIGTGSQAVIASPDGIRRYFAETFVPGRRFDVSLVDVHVTETSEATAFVSAIDTLTVTVPGRTLELPGRLSVCVCWTDQGWRIAGFHRSAMPA